MNISVSRLDMSRWRRTDHHRLGSFCCGPIFSLMSEPQSFYVSLLSGAAAGESWHMPLYYLALFTIMVTVTPTKNFVFLFRDGSRCFTFSPGYVKDKITGARSLPVLTVFIWSHLIVFCCVNYLLTIFLFQAPQGFSNAGGFRGIYSGLGPALLGSAPGAALFFLTYDTTKHFLSSRVPEQVCCDSKTWVSEN